MRHGVRRGVLLLGKVLGGGGGGGWEIGCALPAGGARCDAARGGAPPLRASPALRGRHSRSPDRGPPPALTAPLTAPPLRGGPAVRRAEPTVLLICVFQLPGE